ncbi:hypothetical protein E4U42_002209, partial [Claviceps africana]
GRQDWEGDVDAAPVPADDWDAEIERAVERRLVQVMFTVPKERLRVVNGEDPDPDADPVTDAPWPDLHITPPTPAADRDPAPPLEVVSADEPVGRLSHSTDDSGRRSVGGVYVAEAVRFERPRGRVLRMVQSIERERPLSGGSRGSSGGDKSVRTV